MGFFSRKENVSIRDFSRDYFDAQIFFTKESGQYFKSPPGSAEFFWRSALDHLKKSDPSYSLVDQDVLEQELTALRLELTALSWGHYLQNDQYSLAQSIFTHAYLLHNGKEQIWEAMGAYNHLVAETAVHQTAQLYGYNRQDRQDRQAKIKVAEMMITEKRIKWVEKQLYANVDVKSAGRVGSRIGTEREWQKSIALPIMATYVSKRIGCDVQSDNLIGLASFIKMLYEFPQSVLSDIKITP